MVNAMLGGLGHVRKVAGNRDAPNLANIQNKAKIYFSAVVLNPILIQYP